MIRKKIYSALILSLCVLLFTGSHAVADTGTAIPNALSGGDYSESYLEDVKFDDATGNANFSKTNGDGWYDVDKLDQIYIESFDISGLSGVPIGVTLEIQYSVESGYSGPYPIKWALDGGTLASTGIIPVDGEINVIKTFDLFTQGVDTLAEISTLDIQFKNEDAKGPDAVAFDYVHVNIQTSGGGDTTPPAPPSDVSVTDPAVGGQLDLSWTNPVDSDFDHIHIYRSNTAGIIGSLVHDNVVGMSLSDTGLTNGQTYYYTLRSVDTSSNESTNTDQYNGTPTDVVPPAQVTGLTVTDPGTDGQLDLSWTANGELDLAGYRIYRSNISGETGSLIDSVSVNSYTDTGLTNGTTYYYQVSAYDDSLNEGALSIQETGIPTNAPVQNFSIKGVEYVSWWNGQYSSSDSDISLDNIKNTNANNVGLLVTWYMDTGTSNTIYSDADKTPTDADVVNAIGDIHSRGMEVMLKPHVDSKDGTWRGEIAPSDITAWFNSYNNFITHYAQIAQDNGVEYLCIATELKSLSGTTYESSWNTIIDNIEVIYTDSLTYASNWDEYTNVSFWNRLDYGGLDAYFPLSEAQNPSVTELIDGWSNYSGTWGTHNWVAEIEAWQAIINKPIIFTEIGYRSIDYAAKEPWAWGTSATYNGQLQANCYQAAIEVFKEKTWFTGMYWWDWLTNPNAGGEGNTDFMPQNKPAEATLTALYGGGEINNPPNIPTQPSGATLGNAGTSYSYSTSTTDPDGNQVSYVFDWGDGTTTTTGYVDSGVVVSASHTWSKQGVYTIVVKAIDVKGAESDYSEGLKLRMARPSNALFEEEVYQDLSQMRVYPNPWKSTSGSGGITFDQLSEDVDIAIYNIAGELIYEEKDNSDGSIIWKLKNNRGDSIASGIYIYLLKDENGSKKSGKLAVIK